MPDPDTTEQIHPDPPEEATAEPIPLTPVARQERVAAMDVLRGIAVLGIFLINMPLYLAPESGFFDWENNALWSGSADRLATLFIYIFAQGKFYTLFSFLFGLGFGIQMLRAEERHSPNFLSTYRRRLFVLLAIGILHFTLIWWGDVLHVYALLGFLLILFRKETDKTLLIWAAGLTFIPLVLAIGGTAYEHFNDNKPAVEAREKKRKERKDENEKRVAEDLRVKSSGSLPAILKLRLQRDARQLGSEVGWSTELFTSFLLGLWVSRRRILQEPHLYRPLLNKLAFVALPLAIALSTANFIYGYQHPNQPSPLWRTHLGLICEFLARPAMTFGYAAALLLIGIKSWMSPFAAVGRMALTNYLLHSLVFTTVANSYGLGMYGKIHPVHALALCFAFYAVQLPFSVWWLRHYNYGPAEWLWRSVTYGRRQNLLRCE